MRRVLVASLAAALATACGDSRRPAPDATLRQPAAIAAFVGKTFADPATPRPYFAVANAARNDLSLLDAVTDAPVLAPIRLEPVRVPLERPALLVAASLGDVDQGGAPLVLPDLLVAVSAGDSRLQLVRTWSADNAVVDLLDLEATVVALAALPSAPGTARIAAALAGRRLAVVEYARVADSPRSSPSAPSREDIAPAGFTVGDLPFQVEALAAMPGNPDVVYAASLEPVDGPGGLVFGVGEIALAPGAGGPLGTRAIDARAPTRLVAALSGIQERRAAHPPTVDRATDVTLFAEQPPVDRVYAVLDESGCGPALPIDCGVAVLDPVAGGLLPDPAGRMPYLAPIRLSGRVLALAAAGPPEVGPPDAPGPPYGRTAEDRPPQYMRLWPAQGPVPTTAVAAAALDTGSVAFIDLGRWNLANDAAIATGLAVTPRSTSQAVPVDPGAAPLQQRLWLKGQVPVEGDRFLTAAEAAGPNGVALTPGFTPDDTFLVTWQGVLPGLSERRAEAGLAAPDQIWLALQVGEAAAGGRRVVERVLVADPALGVRAGAGDAGDVVQIDSAPLPACAAALEARRTGPGDRRFDARAAAFLDPDPQFPGGALLLEREGDGGIFDQCYTELVARIGAPGAVATGLVATIRARGLVLTSGSLGYAGRPTLASAVPADDPRQTFALEYPAPPADEDTLTGEEQILARKARPRAHLSEPCTGPDPVTPCVLTSGPVIRFRVDLERTRPVASGDPTEPLRGSVLQLTTTSGVSAFSSRPGAAFSSHPLGAIAFDRSGAVPASGYRFLVPYASDVVLDAGPGLPLAGAQLVR